MLRPEELRAFVEALRGLGLATCHARFDGLELAVAFNPDPPGPVGDLPTPGAWKGPQRLDEDLDLHLPGAPEDSP